MKMLLFSIIASVISFMPKYAAADIKVSDKDGVFLGYLVGDGEITDRSSIRLYFPEYKRIATYINLSGAFSYEIRTTPLLFTSGDCSGDPYISYFATPFDEIFKHTTLGLTYAGSGDIVFINFNSIWSATVISSSGAPYWWMSGMRASSLMCFSISNAPSRMPPSIVMTAAG
jgi:hypothetical protein